MERDPLSRRHFGQNIEQTHERALVAAIALAHLALLQARALHLGDSPTAPVDGGIERVHEPAPVPNHRTDPERKVLRHLEGFEVVNHQGLPYGLELLKCARQ